MQALVMVQWPPLVSLYEAGKSDLTERTLRRLLAAAGVSRPSFRALRAFIRLLLAGDEARRAG